MQEVVFSCRADSSSLAYLRGAMNYYVCGIAYGEVRELDCWLRRRMGSTTGSSGGGHERDGTGSSVSASTGTKSIGQVGVEKAIGA